MRDPDLAKHAMSNALIYKGKRPAVQRALNTQKCQLKVGHPEALTGPQLVEDNRRGKAIGNLPDLGLEIPDRRPRFGAELAIRLAEIVPAPHQQLLQLQPFLAG